MVNPKAVWEDLLKVRAASPLVHNLTNFVVMEPTANALLAIGASPVMTVSEEEVGEMAESAAAVVLNMGTLDGSWKRSAEIAIEATSLRGIPVVLDPVGAGATLYRTDAALALLRSDGISVIRGNASEIATLAGEEGRTKGVDSSLDSQECFEAASELAISAGCAVVVTGRVDFATDGRRSYRLSHGDSLMGRITGGGSIVSALIGAFLAVQSDPLLAATHATALAGVVGEIAAGEAMGPGSFLAAFLDQLYQIQLAQLEELLSESVR